MKIKNYVTCCNTTLKLQRKSVGKNFQKKISWNKKFQTEKKYKKTKNYLT